MRKYHFNYSVVILLILSLTSCNLFNKNTKKIDVSAINLDIEIDRFEQDFFNVDTNHLYQGLSELRNRDTIFFDFYTNQLMRFGLISDSITPTMLDLHSFFTNPYVLGLRDSVQKKYPDLTPLQDELNLALKHYKYYFPNNSIPQFKSIISEFAYNAVALENEYIAISLDMYLGKKYKYYQSFDFPQYIINRFEPEFIVPNAMEVLYNSYYEVNPLSETDALIYAMIEKGKKLYFLECMQPEKPKHLLIGYTKEQLEWCEKSEAEIWKFYNEHDLFYTKNYMEQNKHIGEGPMTPGMPNESPGNVGSWVGWKIVNQYMKQIGEDNIDLQGLLNTPAETILAKSKYKPK